MPRLGKGTIRAAAKLGITPADQCAPGTMYADGECIDIASPLRFKFAATDCHTIIAPTNGEAVADLRCGLVACDCERCIRREGQ